ncbi:hypothetical protein [Deinococcus marmoris]|uniref:Uncharacterized protein n=1 Tax=Deinococcus marmoris TaxID=249408 RepID=A0A1U7NVV5_9DEIO|nr:hypothetical protein [Deinococcus marmoris]OLV17063.1 hypothetical protein BOO71_0010003 [Deinococcus marmoris]
MKLWSILGLIALLLLGAVMSFFTLVASLFASDSGAQDPIGAHFSETMFTMLYVYPVCVIATVVLMILRRGRLALLAAVFPFIYVFGAFIYTAVATRNL